MTMYTWTVTPVVGVCLLCGYRRRVSCVPNWCTVANLSLSTAKQDRRVTWSNGTHQKAIRPATQATGWLMCRSWHTRIGDDTRNNRGTDHGPRHQGWPNRLRRRAVLYRKHVRLTASSCLLSKRVDCDEQFYPRQILKVMTSSTWCR